MSRSKTSKPLPKFDIGNDYKLLHSLGEGAYGTVVAALHKPSGKQVAIKKVLPFEHTLFCLRTLRELKLLRFFSETCVNENASCASFMPRMLLIISILTIIKPPSLEEFKEIYFVQELMQTDLHRVIRTQKLTDDHSQYFIYQTLRALKSIHSAGIVHRDLKPANLLVNANCDLKVCDFGLARMVKASGAQGGGKPGMMTEYVATRWYRAPEIMLSFKMYTKSIDVWAVGCILAEMLSGRPLFPGRDYSHQLELILDVIGTPTLEEFYGITSRRSRDYIRSLPIRKRRPFTAMFPQASVEAIDFLNKTLTFDAKKRMTADEALAHPYLSSYHDPDDEPAATTLDPDYFNFEEENDSLDKAHLKELLYDEIVSFVPSI
ncbi:CMGC/MAPK protein kinase [Russula emetica]|nr:CMGC/MAPK protein kinase [Russula emetica]